MKLTALRLHNIRRFAGAGIAIEGIGDGVNVLCARNEFGKSTCFDALHALFFQAHTGTPAAVKALQPYSGGSPLVEADIVTPQGAFRLTKQFHAGKKAMVREIATGRLVAQADEAERFIASLVEGGTTSPAGLLWVRQGVTGSEKRAASIEDSEKRARDQVLTSVQGEVEALTGGRRMAHAAATCEEELSRLVTATGRPKAGGPYAAAIEQRDQLAAAEQRLQAELRALREALDKRKALRARLKELEDPAQDAARRAAMAQAEAELLAARLRGQALKTAEGELALAENARDAVRQRWLGMRQQRERCLVLRQSAAASEAVMSAALARRREAIAADQAAAAALDAAEREEREARQLLARLDKALRAREAADQLAAARAAHGKAQEARGQVEALEARMKATGLPAAPLQRLEEIEGERSRLAAIVALQAPLLRVAYEPGAAAQISVAGVALADGEERQLAASAEIAIAGVGRLTLTLPESKDGRAKLADIAHRRDALLRELGVDSVSAAKLRAAEAASLRIELDLAKQRLALLAPAGLPALSEAIVRLEAQGAAAEALPDPEMKADPEALRALLAQREEQAAEQRQAASSARPVREAAIIAAGEAERAQAAIAAELAALDEALGPEAERDALEGTLAVQHEAAERALAQAAAHLASLRSAAADLAGAEAKASRMRSVVEGAGRDILKLREELGDLNGQIRTRSDDAVEEAWAEAADRLALARERLASIEREVALLTRLRSALEAARGAAREHYFEPVLGELRPLLGLLFEDATVTFDEETLLPSSVRRNGLDEPVGVLSGGMREQLAVLTRLAFGRLLAKDGQPAPIILDDALVYSDDDRIERMFDALHRQASNQQIIVFSCRQRAFAQLGGNILHMQDWRPEA